MQPNLGLMDAYDPSSSSPKRSSLPLALIALRLEPAAGGDQNRTQSEAEGRLMMSLQPKTDGVKFHRKSRTSLF